MDRRVTKGVTASPSAAVGQPGHQPTSHPPGLLSPRQIGAEGHTAYAPGMPMKPDRQNPFWPAVPRPRRPAPRLLIGIAVLVIALVAARFALRIILG